MPPLRRVCRSRSARVRSACCDPESQGLSETIRVRSIFGRFLEHSRVYSFEANGTSTMFIGSADLMPRNLDHRIEVLVPVETGRTRQELNAILDSVFSDNTNAWELSGDGSWHRLSPAKGERAHTHQAVLRRRVTVRARRQHEGRSRALARAS